MRFSGKLKVWNADRGFGFITPDQGGEDVFVHISDGLHGAPPLLGEPLMFEVARNAEGKKRALKVTRLSRDVAGLSLEPVDPRRERTKPHHIAPPVTASIRPPRRTRAPWSIGRTLITLLLIVGLGTLAVTHYDKMRSIQLSDVALPATLSGARVVTPPPPSARCDGRQHCSQMTSCAEAKFFLNNCPDTRMDGNNDGVPCEQQWCTSTFAR